MPETAEQRIEKAGVVPVLVVPDANSALRVGRILMEEGLPCAEVAFRTPAAAGAIERLREELPDLLVGAGTILGESGAREAARAGARFAMAPGFNPRVARACIELGMEFFPGVCTPTEIEAAMDSGLRVLKFFPAEAMGGLARLKAISAPYSGLRFIPTGGMTIQNLAEYLAWPRVLACGGTWLAPEEWIAQGRWDSIRAGVAAAAAAVRNARE